MPVTPTYPGVHIEEVPSGVRTITGVSTSIAAFVDQFTSGPVNEPVQLFGFGDFEREFGGLDASSEASFGIQQFFLNGGSEAWAVRVVRSEGEHAARKSRLTIADTSGEAAALKLSAISEGAWGDRIRVRIDWQPPVIGEDQRRFNLTVTEYNVNGRAIQRQEIFRNLSVDDSALQVVNDPVAGSKLIRLDEAPSLLPASSGTLSNQIDANALGLLPKVNDSRLSVTITDDGVSTTAPARIVWNKPAGLALSDVAEALQAGIRAARPDVATFGGTTVQVVGDQLWILPGGRSTRRSIAFSDVEGGGNIVDGNENPGNGAVNVGGDNAANTTALKLNGVKPNLAEYSMGTGAIENSAQIAGDPNVDASGFDGGTVNASDLMGSPSAKSGIFALEKVDLFNLLCIPRFGTLAGNLDTANAAAMLANAAIAYCERRRAFFLVDTPDGINDQRDIKAWVATSGLSVSANAAIYYPRVKQADPLADFRLRSFGASGVMAGVYARTDAARGVWKAPAGTEATLRNVIQLDDVLTDAENGALNPLGINCLRTFPIFGNVAWGARTLDGADQKGSEWKYVPVRRLALFLEESLYRGSKWVVFEPNDEPLWAQIRLNIGAFLQNLFRQGAFQGRSPREAYFVKCDKETTTQADINLGIVNIVVGFAPLKPAEFVIIKFQQMAGQLQV